MIAIRISDGPDGFDPQPLEFVVEELMVGRGRDVDVLLPDPSRVISRQHARIFKKNGAYFLKDKSANGTKWNERLLRWSDAEVELSDGDELTVGDYTLIVGIMSGVEKSAPIVTPADDFDLSDLIGRAAPKQGAASPGSPASDVEDIISNYVGPKNKT